jgi:excisionase family DNA binding protein
MAQYTTVEATRKLGVARDTIYRWIKAKHIPTGRITKMGKSKFRTWTDAELRVIQKWMKSNPHQNRGRKFK